MCAFASVWRLHCLSLTINSLPFSVFACYLLVSYVCCILHRQEDVKLVAHRILLAGDSARPGSVSKGSNGAASSGDTTALQNVLDWLFSAVPDALNMTRLGRGDDTSFNLYLIDHSSQELWTLAAGSGNGNVLAPRERASIKNGITGFCARTLQRVVVEDAQVRCLFECVLIFTLTCRIYFLTHSHVNIYVCLCRRWHCVAYRMMNVLYGMWTPTVCE